MDAIGEYTGVKPDEFLTIDRQAMEKSGMIVTDQMGTMTMGRGNMCSTLSRNNGGYRPTVDASKHDGPIDYDTGKRQSVNATEIRDNQSLRLRLVGWVLFYSGQLCEGLMLATIAHHGRKSNRVSRSLELSPEPSLVR